MAQQRPGTTYEGHVVFADGSQVSLQCHEGRPGECPGVLDSGYLCEGPCPDLDAPQEPFTVYADDGEYTETAAGIAAAVAQFQARRPGAVVAAVVADAMSPRLVIEENL